MADEAFAPLVEAAGSAPVGDEGTHEPRLREASRPSNKAFTLRCDLGMVSSVQSSSFRKGFSIGPGDELESVHETGRELCCCLAELCGGPVETRNCLRKCQQRPPPTEHFMQDAGLALIGMAESPSFCRRALDKDQAPRRCLVMKLFCACTVSLSSVLLDHIPTLCGLDQTSTPQTSTQHSK